MKTVCVIFGGASTEHEVSLRSATCVLNNIDREKYRVVMLGITKEGRWYNYTGPVEYIENGNWSTSAFLEEAIISPDPSMGGVMLFDEIITPSIKVRRKLLDGIEIKSKDVGSSGRVIPIDVIFPVLHGKKGEDGTIQGLFELAEIPYVGAKVLSSALCMDKAVAHNLLEQAGVPKTKLVAVSIVDLSDYDKLREKLEEKLTYPMYIKPANAGSSVGVNKVTGEFELFEALREAFLYDSKVVVEQEVVGREIECAVIGTNFPEASSALGEIIPSRDFYDYAGKYLDDSTNLVAPAELPEQTKEEILTIAVKTYKTLCCSGLARVDFFLKDSGEVILNEINTMPGFTSISMYPRLFMEDGITIKNLITRLVDLAFGYEI